MWRSLIRWYKNNLILNQAVIVVLFGWQIFHLYWLTADVVAERVIGHSFFSPSDFYQHLLIVADYFEIPALIGGTILYLSSLKEGTVKKNLVFIFLINSQWLHLFWITDEFVIDEFRNNVRVLPIWLAWLAIFIDYLELPVIYDTTKKFIASLRQRLERL